MATSGTTTFNPDVLEIIEEAYERAGYEQRTGYDLKSARRSLNLLMDEWSNRGINLWTISEGTISLTQSTATYTLPTDTIDLIDHVLRSGTGTDQTDWDLARIGVGTYASLTNKNLEARPLQVYVERTLAPQLTVWPTPDTAYTLVYWRLRRLEDVGVYTNTMDVPSRFLPPMVAGLAYYLAMKKPESVSRVPYLREIYEEQFRLAYEEDRDRSSAYFIPAIVG